MTYNPADFLAIAFVSKYAAYLLGAIFLYSAYRRLVD